MSFLAGPSRRHDVSGSKPTYRHILSPQAMTVSNPLRCIAHCDIDAAYAQFEQVRLGLSSDIPLICAQWTSIIAVNYPARKYGIKRFNTIDEAKRMCPHLTVQHVATYRNGEAEAGYWGEVDRTTHKVSLDPYRRESLKILSIFKEMVPRGEIEKASIDEAFLDLTPMVMERLLVRFPYLGKVPDDAPDGMDSGLPDAPGVEWGGEGVGEVFPIRGEKGAIKVEAKVEEGEEGGLSVVGEDSAEGLRDDVDAEVIIEENTVEEEEEDEREHQASWEDWALCIGAEIMSELRAEVWKRLHYTCSAGIAHNKAMAKLCSAWKKPNNQTILRTSATPAFLRDMAFTDIRYLGGKLGNAIASEYGAKTVGDMLTVPLEEMQKRFGEESIWVYNILRGVDHTEVTPRVATKSMLASKNVKPNVTTPEQGHHWLGVLAGELHVRLRDARELSPGLWPKSLVLSHRTGIDPSRSRQIPFPFTRNLNTEYILKFARKLWDEVTQPMNKGNMKLNNIALSFSGLGSLEEGQKGIETFFGANAAKPIPIPTIKRSRSSSPVQISNLSALPTPNPSPKKPRLPILHTGTKRKTALESFLTNKKIAEASSTEVAVGRNGSPTPAADATPATITIDDDEEAEEVAQSVPHEGRWVCPKCSAVFAPSDKTGESAKAGYVDGQKQEHEDWHFAVDLQGGGQSGGGIKSNVVTQGKVKKKAKKPEGIKAFFAAKPSVPK